MLRGACPARQRAGALAGPDLGKRR